MCQNGQNRKIFFKKDMKPTDQRFPNTFLNDYDLLP